MSDSRQPPGAGVTGGAVDAVQPCAEPSGLDWRSCLRIAIGMTQWRRLGDDFRSIRPIPSRKIARRAIKSCRESGPLREYCAASNAPAPSLACFAFLDHLGRGYSCCARPASCLHPLHRFRPAAMPGRVLPDQSGSESAGRRPGWDRIHRRWCRVELNASRPLQEALLIRAPDAGRFWLDWLAQLLRGPRPGAVFDVLYRRLRLDRRRSRARNITSHHPDPRLSRITRPCSRMATRHRSMPVT